MDPVSQRFGQNLLAQRQRVGISQEELGYRAELHLTHISKMERGQSQPGIAVLAKLCGALGVEPNELMARISWEPPPPPTALSGRFSTEG
jgi:transcriptional regulator with XRE-family HTH domain